MPSIKFKRIVLQSMSFLAQFGYHPQEPSVSELIPYGKETADGTSYEIQFQLLPHFVPPRRRVNVWLFRRSLKPDLRGSHAPLAMDLYNVLRGFYRLDIFTPGEFPWEFSDGNSLSKLLEKIGALLVDYGIKWLEDPKSNLDWVKQPPPQGSPG